MSAAVITVAKNDLPRMAARFGPAVADVINNAVENLLYAADPNTPVDTGALRGNKTIQWASGGAYEGAVYWNQYYAIYVHDGTYRMDGRPFASKAFDIVAPTFQAEMQAVVGSL